MSVFQAELDIATINFNKTLEVECQKLFAATNYTQSRSKDGREYHEQIDVESQSN